MGMRGDMGVLRVAESAGRVVHRTYDVAGEGQRSIVRGGRFGERRHVVVPLGTVDALRREQVGIGALPATGYGGTVEVDQEVMAGGTLHQVDAEVHVFLVLTAEEVNLHTCHANLLAPGKLLLAVLGLVQTVFRCRSTVHPAY